MPSDPAIPLLGIYPKKKKSLFWKNTCTAVFIAGLFTIAEIREKPKGLSIDARLSKSE